MNADLVIVLKPLGERFDEILSKVLPIARTSLLKGVIQVLRGDFRDVDGVLAKVEVVAREECVSVTHSLEWFSVDPMALVGAAVISERNLLVHPHGVDQLAVPGAFGRDAASSSDPVAFLDQLDDVALAGAVLALRQSAQAAERAGGEPAIVVHDVRVELRHDAILPIAVRDFEHHPPRPSAGMRGIEQPQSRVTMRIG
jgi:hypothetical protein